MFNVLLMYSKGVKTLCEDLGYEPNEDGFAKAQAIYDAVLKAYPDMAKWMKATEANAMRLGYVDNIYGRRRRLPELLLPEYEVDFPEGTPEETKKYYTAFYRGKLKRARFWKDREKIIQQALQKGINISSNQQIIAEKKRNIINFCIQGCLISNSHVTTQEYGVVEIHQLEGKQFHIWDGENFVKAGCIYSGKKQKVKITLWDKRVIECIPNHKFLFKNTQGKTYFKTADELAKMKSDVKRLVTSDGTEPSLYTDTVRIRDIEITDEYVDMWDIVDSESHKFVVEGVVSHNSAAVITLRAMRNISNNERLKELGCKLVMSIHDKLRRSGRV